MSFALGGDSVVTVSDYIASALADAGVRHLFMLVGGGAMHLNDSLGHEPRLKVVFNQHEQACAMAAEGYARVSGRVGVVNVTTGPGGINALNGVFGAWTDSIPLLVISGQVKRETCMAFNDVSGLRQLGDQEVDIISMAKGITKYAVVVREPETIRYHLERALFLASSGRPGPCWLDVPADVQSAQVELGALVGYDRREDELVWDRATLERQVQEVLHRLQRAERPVIMVGTGIRLAGAMDVFERVARRLGLPVTTAWTAPDLLASDDPLYCGRPGTIGDRAGNFTVQNADLLLVIGSRLNIRQVSYNWDSFARSAFKVQVDVDEAELRKLTVRPDLAVHCDARVFVEELERQLAESDWSAQRHAQWLAWCRQRVARYPVVLDRHRNAEGPINPYHFVDVLLRGLTSEDIVVCGNGSASVIAFQVAAVKKGQRLFANSGNASMGYDLPAAIGAAVANNGKRVICLAGDGSLQLNIQELETVVSYDLPIKLFVLNNGGYVSMRQTQSAFFGRCVGAGPDSGLRLPDVVKVAGAYGIPAWRIKSHEFEDVIGQALEYRGPTVCDVVVDAAQVFEPKTSSRRLDNGRIVSAPLEDLAPFLSREELQDNMLVAQQDL